MNVLGIMQFGLLFNINDEILDWLITCGYDISIDIGSFDTLRMAKKVKEIKIKVETKIFNSNLQLLPTKLL